MLQILRQYIEGGFQVTEYTRDGETVSHRIETPVMEPVENGESLPVPPTFAQRLEALEMAMLMSLDEGL